jgi:hypothetical protein
MKKLIFYALTALVLVPAATAATTAAKTTAAATTAAPTTAAPPTESYVQKIYDMKYGRFGQPASVEANHAISLSVIGLSYAYEHPIARRATVIGRVGAEFGGVREIGFYKDNYLWMIAPSIDIEPRFYHSLDRRERRARSTAGNSATFAALQVRNILPFGYTSDSSRIEIAGATFLTPMLGLRRVWGAGWLFELMTGYSFVFDWSGSRLSGLALDLRFGYAF